QQLAVKRDLTRERILARGWKIELYDPFFGANRDYVPTACRRNWFEQRVLPPLLYRESACSTQTRPSPAAIAMRRSSSRVVNRSFTQVAALIIRPAGARRAVRRAKPNAPIRSGQPATPAAA